MRQNVQRERLGGTIESSRGKEMLSCVSADSESGAVTWRSGREKISLTQFLERPHPLEGTHWWGTGDQRVWLELLFKPDLLHLLSLLLLLFFLLLPVFSHEPISCTARPPASPHTHTHTRTHARTHAHTHTHTHTHTIATHTLTLPGLHRLPHNIVYTEN